MSVTTYKATATRSGRWWAVEIKGLPPNMVGVTQGRTLDHAEEMAREVIALLLDVPEETIAVELTVAGSEPALTAVEAARKAQKDAERAVREAILRFVHDLAAQGVSQRDSARILGLSHQRVNQLLNDEAA